MIARFSHRPAHGLGRRLLDAWRGRFVGGLGKSQRVYFVELNGQRYKRVVFGDSALAGTVVAAMRACAGRVELPQLVHHHENELWLEFISGARPDARADRAALAGFFASINQIEARQSRLAQTPWPAQLRTDLDFVRQAGVIDSRLHARLTDQAAAQQPEQVWLGLDYVDPVLKNFVLRENKLVVIDLESLARDSLLGIGLAKCSLHWLADDLAEFTDQVVAAGAPDLRPQLDYARLCLVAGWTKRKLLAGKRGRIQRRHFETLLS